ncbi:MAG: hypothetical protein Ct9H90mP9_5260 [Pseudomonadota bacterium]|nr:MAG: hypothetical protein Ct9H90mP9_5260 [Pseudomonadota bacterium]
MEWQVMSRGLDQALANDRVPGTPALLKALSSSGANPTDFSFPNPMRTTSGLRISNFLREARVVIVLIEKWGGFPPLLFPKNFPP